MNPDSKSYRVNIILVAIILLMGIEIIYLVHQNRQLKSIINDPKQYFKTLEKGDMVPSLRAEDIDGDDLSIKYGPGEPYTVIFWFSPSCSSCGENLTFWNELYSGNKSDIFRFIGFCAGTPPDARDMAAESNLQFPIICATDQYIVDSYKGNVVPQTVTVSPDGRIRNVWPGELTERQKREILAFMANPDSIISKGGE